jgi:hypothetical protein
MSTAYCRIIHPRVYVRLAATKQGATVVEGRAKRQHTVTVLGCTYAGTTLKDAYGAAAKAIDTTLSAQV